MKTGKARKIREIGHFSIRGVSRLFRVGYNKEGAIVCHPIPPMPVLIAASIEVEKRLGVAKMLEENRQAVFSFIETP